MYFEEEEEACEDFQRTLLVVREITVYKIPPWSASGGYMSGEWLQSHRISSGRLRVVSCKVRCEIRLEDASSSELFAACFVYQGQRETSVQTVLDSSRHFVLKIEDGCGKYAFIGLGFVERNEAFDFNVALSDHEKYAKRVKERDASDGKTSDSNHIDINPVVNRRLKEGESIRITIKPKPMTGIGMLTAAGLSGSPKPKPLSPDLSPPPGAGKIRSPLPPPPHDPIAARSISGGVKLPQDNQRHRLHSSNPSSDSCHIERNHPLTNGSGITKRIAAGWEAF